VLEAHTPLHTICTMSVLYYLCLAFGRSQFCYIPLIVARVVLVFGICLFLEFFVKTVDRSWAVQNLELYQLDMQIYTCANIHNLANLEQFSLFYVI
jgi:hypothetical protein